MINIHTLYRVCFEIELYVKYIGGWIENTLYILQKLLSLIYRLEGVL